MQYTYVHHTTHLSQASSLLNKTIVVSKISAEPPTELWEDDLAGKIQNEYDPMVPNNYEMIMKQKRAEERSKENEVYTTVEYSYISEGDL